MRIEVRNDYATVLEQTDEERRWITGFLTFDDPTAHFRGDHGSRERVYEPLARRFPSGFVYLAMKGAAEMGIQLQVDDLRAAPCVPDPAANLSWLRPNYQIPAVAAVEQYGQGILWCPTGSGKTEIAAGVVLRLPTRWLFMVHRAQLAEDAAERYKLRTGDEAGVIGEGRWEPRPRLTCATYQSIYEALANKDNAHHTAALELAMTCGGFIADEGHTLAARTFWTCAMAMKAAYYRVAMSGTPLDRSDKRSIMVRACTGKVIYRVKPDTLIEEGVLAKPIIRMVPLEQESACATHQGVYGELVVRSQQRNALLVDMARAATKPALLFVREIEHGRLVAKSLGRAGVNTDFIWGSDSVSRRKDAIKRLVRGDIEVLVCSVVFQEGVDIPPLRSVVVGTGGKSVIAALQRIGRGMRPHAGKEDGFEVYDVLDRGQRWMADHAKGRHAAYSREGYDVRVG